MNARKAPNRVLVTGGAGFIGSHTVAALLARGAQVCILDDFRHACPAPLPSAAEVVRAELSSPQAARAVAAWRPDQVLHLAAQGGVSRSIRDPHGDAQVNVLGTIAMLAAARDAGVRRFVFASSGGAIYGHARRLPTAETAVARPLSPYGAAKLAAEGYLGLFRRSFALSTLALRYSNVYGPNQDGTGEAGVVAITCERLLSRKPPQVRGDGEQTRDFVYVADVASANLAALWSRVTGALNVGTGRGTSVNEVVDTLARLAPPGSPPVERVAARPGEVRHTYLDVRKAGAALSWRAETELETGLRLTLAAFAAQAAAIPGKAGSSGGPALGSPAG